MQRSRPYGVTFAIAIAVFAVVLVLYIQPSLQERSPIAFNTWVTIGNFVILVMLILLVIWKITLSTEVEDYMEPGAEVAPPIAEHRTTRVVDEVDEPVEELPRPARAKPKRVVVKTIEPEEEEEDEVLPKRLHLPQSDLVEEEIEDLPRIIEYPDKESGGVYSDALIKVDSNLMLALRTLIGKVCKQCDEEEKCQQRVKGKLDEEVFSDNFECTKGLKRELSKARKKRQAEEAKAAAAKELVKEKADKDADDGATASEDKPKPKSKAKAKTKPKAKGASSSKGSEKKASK